MACASVRTVPSPAAETRDLDELVEVLHNLGWVDHRRQMTITMERLVGWESAVVRTDDGWIYRFSRMDADSFHREVAVLAAVNGRIGLPTPRVELVDTTHRVIAYRTITGHQLDLDGVLSLPAAGRHDLVESFATTLAAMHDLSPDLPDGILVPALNATDLVDVIRATTRRQLDTFERDTLELLLTAWKDTALAQPCRKPSLLHGDFHPGNMVFAAPTGPLAGLWDFSCVELGDPSSDMRYLVGDSLLLSEEIVDAYQSLTGHLIDLTGSRLIFVFEQIADAIEENRPIGQVLRAWHR